MGLAARIIPGTTYSMRKAGSFFSRFSFLPVIMCALLLTACGGAGVGEDDESATAAIGTSNGSGGGGCASSILANAWLENPRQDVSGKNNPAFTADLGSYGSEVTVADLDGSCLLKNSFVQITEDDFGAVANTGDDLRLTPNDLRFQQVNAYYHANRARKTVQAAGGDLSSLSGLVINAHCSVLNNAFYSPFENEVCLGGGLPNPSDSSEILWGSDDADVVIHEFAHAINHKLASTNIMSSSSESGALDEGTADYWAHTHSGNPVLSEWFLGLLEEQSGTSVIRDASNNNVYPGTKVQQVHRDGRPWAEALWSIRQSLGANTTDRLVAMMTELFPPTLRFKQAVDALRTAAFLQSLSAAQRSSIDTILSNKGLLRTSDNLSGNVALSDNSGHESIYIIDDHHTSFQVGGNCNGVLDVGETALVVVNLEYAPDAQTGMVVGTINTPAGITIPAGGGVAEYMRFNGNGEDFVDVLQDPGVFDGDATLYASFLIRATSAGTKNFTLTLSPMGGTMETIDFSVDVGTTATRASNCPGGGQTAAALWPAGLPL